MSALPPKADITENCRRLGASSCSSPAVNRLVVACRTPILMCAEIPVGVVIPPLFLDALMRAELHWSPAFKARRPLKRNNAVIHLASPCEMIGRGKSRWLFCAFADLASLDALASRL